MTVSLETKRAEQPFQFMAASYLIRIGAQPVYTLGDFAKSLRTCPQASIFYHTFQSLEAHHYTSFSSDFAQWALAACNEAALAEQLAVVDLRDIVTLEELREIAQKTKPGVLVAETISNPLLKVCDVAACADIAHAVDVAHASTLLC